VLVVDMDLKPRNNSHGLCHGFHGFQLTKKSRVAQTSGPTNSVLTASHLTSPIHLFFLLFWPIFT